MAGWEKEDKEGREKGGGVWDLGLLTAPAWSSCEWGMGRAIAREWRRPGPLLLHENGHPLVHQTPEDSGKRRRTREEEDGHKGDEGNRTRNPPEAVRDLDAGRGQQRRK